MNMDAISQARAIKSGALSVSQVLEDTIDRIEKFNPKLNAVVSYQFDEAREMVKNLSQEAIDSKPFPGVPLLLKDLDQNQMGHINTSGSKLFKNYRSHYTDAYVKTFEDLGFVILGRTNTPEFGFKNVSDSQLHGQVNLPMDLSRNAGGSSGGAAAAVSSGMLAIACASDGGGSIRIPASFNGLIGLKPTRGRIPVGPSSYRGWQGASVNFALTKSIEDTKTLLYHLQVYQVESPFPLTPLSYDSLFPSQPFPKLKIALLSRSPIDSQVSNDAKVAVRDAGRLLEKLGHEVVHLDQWPLDGIAVMKAYYIMNSVETAAMFDDIESALGRKMTRNDMELMTWAIYQSGQKISAKHYSHILNEWDQYSVTMAQFHKQYDLLLTPTTNGSAPLHGQFKLSEELTAQLEEIENLEISEQQELIWQMFADSLAWTPYTQLANLTGQPAISLPTYQTESGLPMGIQLMAAKGREDQLLAIGRELEDNGFLKTSF